MNSFLKRRYTGSINHCSQLSTTGLNDHGSVQNQNDSLDLWGDGATIAGTCELSAIPWQLAVKQSPRGCWGVLAWRSLPWPGMDGHGSFFTSRSFAFYGFLITVHLSFCVSVSLFLSAMLNQSYYWIWMASSFRENPR